MAREYIVKFTDQTVAGAITVLFANPPAGRAIELVKVQLNQRGSTTSEMIGVSLGFKGTAFPTLVSATPEKTKSGDPSSYITGNTTGAAGTSGVIASTEGAGTFTEKIPDSFLNVQGYLWTPVARERLIVAGADALALAVKLRNTPTGTTLWSGSLTFAELDGG